ncbi:hypothetical protein EES44_07780 [Streptomyces sp. ADI96-15]|uniref:hypothetical protein n=1 Tax=Streptomyces sp. ADI96-15 TaxID=1522761 RepID=UPI000FA0ED5D|nr:hypothetical protein [Streptomyces sp. ADI96-15]RPK69182.1 hypothetical protein EES44_07780 [Streptomyces sp. ADI96-15]
MRMTHDAVEDPIEVPEISVRHYERSGWKVADQQPVTTTTAPAARRGRKEERDS